MSPEVATSKPWRQLFSSCLFLAQLVVVAVDEAHCITEWGPDFRHAFRRIGGLRALSRVPYMTLTASAPSAVEADIVSSLSLSNVVYIKHPLNRRNIFLAVKTKSSFARDLSGIMQKVKSCGSSYPKTVIFCKQKNTVCDLYTHIRRTVKADCATVYHASLSQETKDAVFSMFSRASSLKCLVSTVAFGMGVDISDIQIVVVYGLPSSLLQLYQLIGRAGRNGSPACAMLLTNKSELKGCKDKSLADFVTLKETCRRVTLLKGLGSTEDVQPVQWCCDVCHSVPSTFTFLYPVKAKRAARAKAIRKVPAPAIEILKRRLLAERQDIIFRSGTSRVLGGVMLCPLHCVNVICERVNYIKEFEDVSSIPGMKDIFARKFFDILTETLNI